jgi:hypothetical protein
MTIFGLKPLMYSMCASRVFARIALVSGRSRQMIANAIEVLPLL